MISPVSSVPSLLAPCFLRGVLCGYILRIPFEPIEVDPPEPVKYNAFSLEIFDQVISSVGGRRGAGACYK